MASDPEYIAELVYPEEYHWYSGTLTYSSTMVTDMQEDKISELLKASNKKAVSIDTPFTIGEDNSLIDVLPNSNSLPADCVTNDESIHIEINRALNTLQDRSREILKMYYGIGCQELDMEEIANKFGITRERVRQIKEESIKKLRKNSNFLKELL